MCNNCKPKSDVIHTFNFNNVSMEVFVEDGELTVNAYNHQFEYTEDIVGSFKINYCPICGRKFN